MVMYDAALPGAIVAKVSRTSDHWPRGHEAPHQSTSTVRRRSAFAMTLTDDNAIAAAATTGESRSPKNG